MIENRSETRRYSDQVSLQAAQMLVLALGESDAHRREELIGFARRMSRHARWLVRSRHG